MAAGQPLEGPMVANQPLQGTTTASQPLERMIVADQPLGKTTAMVKLLDFALVIIVVSHFTVR